jgi:hypothetical protein
MCPYKKEAAGPLGTHTQRRSPLEDRGRDQSDAATSQRMLTTVTRGMEQHGPEPPVEPPEEAWLLVTSL